MTRRSWQAHVAVTRVSNIAAVYSGDTRCPTDRHVLLATDGLCLSCFFKWSLMKRRRERWLWA